MSGVDNRLSRDGKAEASSKRLRVPSAHWSGWNYLPIAGKISSFTNFKRLRNGSNTLQFNSLKLHNIATKSRPQNKKSLHLCPVRFFLFSANQRARFIWPRKPSRKRSFQIPGSVAIVNLKIFIWNYRVTENEPKKFFRQRKPRLSSRILQFPRLKFLTNLFENAKIKMLKTIYLIRFMIFPQWGRFAKDLQYL